MSAAMPPTGAAAGGATGAAPSPPRPRTGFVRDRGVAVRPSVTARRWRSDGVAKILGPVEVDEADVGTMTTILGSLTAERFAAHGALDVQGPIDVRGRLTVDGALRAFDRLHAGDCEVGERVVVRGPIEVDGRLRWRGPLTAPSLRAVQVIFSGGCDVAGRVDAEVVDGTLERPSRAEAIRAAAVRIRLPPRPLEKVVPPPVRRLADDLLGGRSPLLTVLRIEAGEVELEGVDAEFVRAERIRLGPYSRVARYEGTLTAVDSSAIVGPASISPRPYGLAR